jgi:hypothetical protein
MFSFASCFTVKLPWLLNSKMDLPEKSECQGCLAVEGFQYIHLLIVLKQEISYLTVNTLRAENPVRHFRTFITVKIRVSCRERTVIQLLGSAASLFLWRNVVHAYFSIRACLYVEYIPRLTRQCSPASQGGLTNSASQALQKHLRIKLLRWVTTQTGQRCSCVGSWEDSHLRCLTFCSMTTNIIDLPREPDFEEAPDCRKLASEGDLTTGDDGQQRRKIPTWSGSDAAALPTIHAKLWICISYGATLGTAGV